MSRTIPRRHTHNASDIVGGVLPAASIPAGLFAPIHHQHEIADIIGLQAKLDMLFGTLGSRFDYLFDVKFS